MIFLVDTNVISEISRPKPDESVIDWIDVHEDELWLSVISIAEIRSGIEQMPAGKRRIFLSHQFLETVQQRFRDRIFSITPEIAEMWGHIAAHGFRAGRPVGVLDGFLAATCRIHQCTLATRNTRDFDYLGVQLVNPWD